MPNPVLVFVDPGRVDGLAEKKFPIGLREDGAMDAPAQEREYAVLLANDTDQKIPLSNHTNKNANEILLIVTHNRSTFHQKPTLPIEWGRSSFICKTFSHIPNDTNFLEICALVGDATTVQQFVRKCQGEGYLAWLDELASICQIEMIDSTIETEGLLGELTRNFPLPFQDDFWGKKTWEKRLEFIREEAIKFVN